MYFSRKNIIKCQTETMNRIFASLFLSIFQFIYFFLASFSSSQQTNVYVFCNLFTAEEDDQQDAEEAVGGEGSGDSDDNLAKIAANVSVSLLFSLHFRHF